MTYFATAVISASFIDSVLYLKEATHFAKTQYSLKEPHQREEELLSKCIEESLITVILSSSSPHFAYILQNDIL